jgi:hypothetical protein
MSGVARCAYLISLSIAQQPYKDLAKDASRVNYVMRVIADMS